MAYEMNQLLEAMVENGASDLHIHVGRSPSLRVNGTIVSIDGTPLTVDDAKALVLGVVPPSQLGRLDADGGCEASEERGQSRRRHSLAGVEAERVVVGQRRDAARLVQEERSPVSCQGQERRVGQQSSGQAQLPGRSQRALSFIFVEFFCSVITYLNLGVFLLPKKVKERFDKFQILLALTLTRNLSKLLLSKRFSCFSCDQNYE